MLFRSEKPCSRPYARAAAVLLPLCAAFAANDAHATLSVMAASHGSSAGNNAYYGITGVAGMLFDTDLVDAQGFVNVLGFPVAHTGFRGVDITKTQTEPSPYSNMILLDVTSYGTTYTANPGDQTVLEITANIFGTSNAVLAPIAGAGNPVGSCVNGGAVCYQDPTFPGSGGNYFYAVPFTAGSTLRIGIYPQDICYQVFSRSGSQAAAGCNSSNVTVPTAGTQTQMQLNFNVTNLLSLTTMPQPSPPPALDTLMVNLRFQADKPSTTCSITTGLYNPGDSQIYLNTSFIGMNQAPGAAGPSVLAVVGGIGATVSFPTMTSSLHSQYSFVQEIIPGGTQSVYGFQNMTSKTDSTHLYNLGFLYRDQAGILAVPTSGCTVNGVATAPIQGFLNASKCFIATAAFRSADAGPVRMLRSFRDRFLLKFGLGQRFVHWYYDWSPPAAEWMIRNPEFRIPVLVLLFPLEVFAWLVLHPFIFAALALAQIAGIAILREAS